MKKGKIPGCAFALVDKEGIVWTEGFGYADCKHKTLVTPDTLFCLQSVSKTLTATAVLLAAQEGLADLYEPITTYLPDFKVNSRYEENPEQKMTLRYLLSHTAGFPREATIGNFAEPTGSFEERVRSIYDTWLICPVGRAFNYSNIGTDLAAYILQAVSGMPFEQYMTEHLFRPLSMSSSVVGSAGHTGQSSRATGYTTGIKTVPYIRPHLGSGNIYSSVVDYAKIIQLHLDKGTIENTRFLDESLLDAMNTPYAVSTPPNIHYGLGMGIDKQPLKGATLRLGHIGMGVGFTAVCFWYPEYGLGMVVLANKFPVVGVDHTQFVLTLTNRLIEEKLVEKQFELPKPDYLKCVDVWDSWPDHNSTSYKSAWDKYCGTYQFRITGIQFKWWAGLAFRFKGGWPPQITIHEEDDFLCVTEGEFIEHMGLHRHINQPLQEQKPDLFFTPSGIALDFTGEAPTWRNFRLVKSTDNMSDMMLAIINYK
jgi:CubicO group peptidase (beta-lactamase class C family)